MTALLAALIVLAVAAFVARPLLVEDSALEAPLLPTGQELWSREKAVAVLAITEADFDRATGKLSEDDYRVLRSDYEGRALQAMDEMEKLAPEAGAGTTAPSAVRFCGSCGRGFGDGDSFCAGCGRARAAA